MKKNLLRRFFAIVLLLAITTLTWAYDFEANGIYYHKNSDGISVTVTYKTTSYNSYSGSVVIPSTVTYNDTEYSVTSIGGYAFYGCSGLTSVTIPNSVTSIGSYAFFGCRGLTSVTIPNSVTTISNYAFSGCRGLTSVTIPNSVTTISNYAFSGCSGLTSVTIPNSVTSIGKSAFNNCSGLTSVTIPNSVTSIGESAFNNCSGLKKAEFASIESLCKILFSSYASNPLYYAHHLYINGQEVTDVVIPNSVTSIGDNAFRGCSGLTSIDIPNSVTSIGDYAFYDCSGLTSVTIGNSVTSIGSSAFCNCSSLTSVTIPNSVTSIDKYAFYNCSSLTSVTIGNSVTSIGNYAFSKCSGLTSVTIGNNVTSIGNYAFEYCNGLKKAEFASIESLCNISFGYDANPLYYAKHLYINGQEVTDLVIPNSVTSIEYGTFYNCSSLTSISIPNSVTSIGGLAFSGCPNVVDIIVEAGNSVYDSRNSCKAIIETATNALVLGCKYTSIPNDVTEIKSRAFSGMASYMSLTIPASVSVIHTNAFDNYERLNLSFMGSTTPEIEDNAFSDITKVYATVPRGSSIAYSSFGFAEVIENKDEFPLITVNLTEPGMLQDKILDMDDTDIRRLKISGPITASDISYLRSSSRFTNLAYLDISEITLIPSDEPYANFSIQIKYGTGGTMSSTYARFYIYNDDHNELVSQVHHALGGVNSIYAYHSRTLAGAFTGMNLEHVILPTSFDGAGAFCFMDCKKLQKVSLPNNDEFKFIDEFAFYGCKSLEELSLPSSVDSISSKAFSGCGMLNNIGRLDNVKHLGDCAFASCTSLRNVGSLASVEKLGISCFDYCSSLIGDIETGILDLSSCNNIPDAKSYGVFEGCSSLKKVIFSKNLKSIGDDAFKGCTNISSITLPEGLETIKYSAFNSCSNLSAVNCPNSLLHVGYNAFNDTPFAQTLELDNGVLYMKHIAMSASSFSSISFREGTRSIADGFKNTIEVEGKAHPESCKSITLPSTLLCIGEGSFSGVGITSLALPESIEYIGSSAFAKCTSLSGTLTIPEKVSFIGSSAFSECSSLTVVYYNANTREGAGSSTFYACTGVEKVTIGPKVEIIPEGAFGKTNIYKLVFAERTDATPLYVGVSAFAGCNKIKDIVLPNGTDSIGEYAFNGCSSIKGVIIPNSVTSIGRNAFYDCKSLTSVTIGNKVESIGQHVFTNCSGLTSITIPNSVTSIGGGAFANCSSLTSVTIGNSVTSIGNYAFEGCSGLTSVTCLAEQVPITGVYCFSGVPQGSATLYVPESSIGLYKSAYSWKDFGTILPIAESEYSVGDANGNGEVEIGDVTSVLTLMATPEATGYNNKAADANGNGVIEIGDVTTILTIMAEGE